jgi:lysophospholipase L1-like esterase
MNRLGSGTSGRAVALAAVLLSMFAGCSKAPPTSSTPTTTTSTTTTTSIPVAEPPSLNCPAGLPFKTISFSGDKVTYPLPATSNGELPVSVACTPAPGSTFPLGDTSVSCTATDARSRTATCSFIIQLTRVSSLTRTRFLAFGDSITAGEVTFPVGSTAFGRITKLVQVPSAAYPTVLAKNLQAAYPLQEDSISVANYGLGGERAQDARDRFIRALGTVNPQAVLIMEGYNDIGGGADGSASSAAREIRTMAAEAKARGMRVFIANLAPGRPGNRQLASIYITDYNGRMLDVARGEGAVFVDIFAALSQNVNLYIGADGLHPTEIGYAKMAETFMTAIRNDLDSR